MYTEYDTPQDGEILFIQTIYDDLGRRFQAGRAAYIDGKLTWLMGFGQLGPVVTGFVYREIPWIDAVMGKYD